MFLIRYISYIYAPGHPCKYLGCKTVIVIDGNMKNRRNVCAATEAGYLEYEGLKGNVKTGCPMTPFQTSQYCYHHVTRVLKSDVEDKSTHLGEEGIVKVIISKRETRNGVYYQVIYYSNICM